jgi:hypothetical protein
MYCILLTINKINSIFGKLHYCLQFSSSNYWNEIIKDKKLGKNSESSGKQLFQEVFGGVG